MKCRIFIFPHTRMMSFIFISCKFEIFSKQKQVKRLDIVCKNEILKRAQVFLLNERGTPSFYVGTTFYSIFLFLLTLQAMCCFVGPRKMCVTKIRGWFWFFIDFNWPYQNDADINISFNDPSSTLSDTN